MKPLLSTVLLALGIATTATAQVVLHQDGPFALRIKGQAKNSSIDGYLHTVDLGPVLVQKPVQYEAIAAPPVGNTSYEFYFNYTGNSQSDSRNYTVGFFLTDPTVGSVDNSLSFGKAMSIQYAADSNVAFALFGSGSATATGFDADNKTFIEIYFDDSTFVPGQPPRQDQTFIYYHWALCWQFFGRVYMPSLSWITYGQPHNPTCEPVDLIKEALPGYKSG